MALRTFSKGSKASNKEYLGQTMLSSSNIEPQSHHCIGLWTFGLCLGRNAVVLGTLEVILGT